jgi:hypothetical protein
MIRTDCLRYLGYDTSMIYITKKVFLKIVLIIPNYENNYHFCKNWQLFSSGFSGRDSRFSSTLLEEFLMIF